jgi:hypothetical protein
VRPAFARAYTLFVHGRLAIAAIESQREDRPRLVAEARKVAGRLEKENDAWTRALALFVSLTRRFTVSVRIQYAFRSIGDVDE